MEQKLFALPKLQKKPAHVLLGLENSVEWMELPIVMNVKENVKVNLNTLLTAHDNFDRLNNSFLLFF